MAEAIEQLKARLFYLQTHGEKYFSAPANLNRILLSTMENVKDADLIDLERGVAALLAERQPLQKHTWEDRSLNIADSEDIKLVILQKADPALINDMLKSKGQTPRVSEYRVLSLSAGTKRSALPRSNARLPLRELRMINICG